MSTYEFTAGYRAGALFAIDQAQRVADGVEARVATKRADGAASALRVLAEELLGEIERGGAQASALRPMVPSEGAAA